MLYWKKRPYHGVCSQLKRKCNNKLQQNFKTVSPEKSLHEQNSLSKAGLEVMSNLRSSLPCCATKGNFAASKSEVADMQWILHTGAKYTKSQYTYQCTLIHGRTSALAFSCTSDMLKGEHHSRTSPFCQTDKNIQSRMVSTEGGAEAFLSET